MASNSRQIPPRANSFSNGLSESFKDLCAVAAVPVQPTSKLSAAFTAPAGKRSTAADLLTNDKMAAKVRHHQLACPRPRPTRSTLALSVPVP